MREFEDQDGRVWVASVGERPGLDFKGRYYWIMRPKDAGKGGEIALEDIRWNSRKTAQRTLETMSEVELRRRLRSARGRAGVPE